MKPESPRYAEQHSYYEANKEKIKARNKKWREENKAQHDASKAAWREKNKEHEAAVNKAYREKNKEKISINNRFKHIKRKYGLSREDYLAMLDKQNHACAICLLPFTDDLHVCVDHCHITGVVRGLLCDPCNNGAGRVKDNPERLEAIAKYMRERTPRSS